MNHEQIAKIDQLKAELEAAVREQFAHMTDEQIYESVRTILDADPLAVMLQTIRGTRDRAAVAATMMALPGIHELARRFEAEAMREPPSAEVPQ